MDISIKTFCGGVKGEKRRKMQIDVNSESCELCARHTIEYIMLKKLKELTKLTQNRIHPKSQKSSAVEMEWHDDDVKKQIASIFHHRLVSQSNRVFSF